MSDDETRVSSWAEVIRRAIEAKLLDLHTGLPGKVVKYDASKQQADVQPLLKGSFIDEDDVRQVESMPVIVNCPVMFPQAGGYSITFPVAVDDRCWIHFSEASIDALLDAGAETDPGDGARHALSDAFISVGWRPFKDPLRDAPTDKMSLGMDGGPRIAIDGSIVTVSGSGFTRMDVGAANDFVAMAAATKKGLDGLHDKLRDHTHPALKYTMIPGSGGASITFSAAGSADTGDIAKTGTSIDTIDAVASKNLKAEKP